MRTLLHCLMAAAACASLHAETMSLFDGRTLEGWDYDPKMWRVEDGVITGGSRTEKITHNDFIATKKSFQNFDLKLKIKVSGDPATGMLNSGIQIRSVRVPGGAHMCGYQVDCGKGWFGKIYDEYRRNKVIAEPVDPAALEKVVDVYGWNEYRIRADGRRIQTWINGVLAIDYLEEDERIAQDGRIAPQVHSGGVCLVQLKDITIEELPPTPGLATWESLGGVEAARKLVAPPPKKAATPAPKAPANATKKGGRDISYNAVQGEARTAEEQRKLFKLPAGYEVELVVKESEGLGKFISVYFDQRGRMWTQTALEYPVDANENPAAAEALYAGEGRDKIVVFPREALNAVLPPGGLTNPVTFADGLAIPLGILPWGPGDACYVQHGHDIALLKDTDKDGKADKREVILTGFGIQDSHLFPHQFTRAPGGWIWMAQGLFNKGAVKKPGGGEAASFDMCRMARFRPDGSGFEATSVGPNNVWGLAITGEGEAFIQEANDYGYPVMPFHEYAYYPSGSESLKKSYQPDFPPTAEFRMGGTGLSGLALGEGELRKLTPALNAGGICMFVANPITSKVQTIAMHRDGPYWKLEQAPDLITCDDPFFRPVALTNGPDGCIYIVDWYNKIISHNEVPRNHPDRDKTRGRIWRVKAVAERTGVSAGNGPAANEKSKAAVTSVRPPIPDFTRLSGDELIAMLGTQPAARAHLAWQTLADRSDPKTLEACRAVADDEAQIPARRAQARWCFLAAGDDHWTSDQNPNLRQEAIKRIGRRLQAPEDVAKLLEFVRPSLTGPLIQAGRGNKMIPTREAYDREFERFLVRMFLERHPALTATYLDSHASTALPLEALLLASLALEPKASAARIARLVPRLERGPNEEELLRLAQFPEEPGVSNGLRGLLTSVGLRKGVAEKLLAAHAKLDFAKLAPILTGAAKQLLSGTEEEQRIAIALIGNFKLELLAGDLLPLLRTERPSLPALQALRQLRMADAELLEGIATSARDPRVRGEALAALAESGSADAAPRIISLYPRLAALERRETLASLSSSRGGADAIVAAVLAGRLPSDAVDPTVAERLNAVLGQDAELEKLMRKLGATFQSVLTLDGADSAWCDSGITLKGAFTVETWVRLTGSIQNEDGILGAPGELDMNFYQGRFRVWVGGGAHDVVVAKKPIAPDLWTHVAVTRNREGTFNIYLNGELDSQGAKSAGQAFEGCRIGWTQPNKGTEGSLCEFRVWNRERTPQEIRAAFDRSIEGKEGMVRYDGRWGRLGKGTRVAKTIDAPPLMSEAAAAALDAKFSKYQALAAKGRPDQGKPFAALCISCHQIGNGGGQIGPNLSGAGAMGLEAVLRNILTPNAAMEPGYRIYRVEMNSGDLVDAFFVSEDASAVVVRQPGLPDRRIPKPDIRAAKYVRRSLMPEGLLDALPDEAAGDLLSYLMTLK